MLPRRKRAQSRCALEAREGGELAGTVDWERPEGANRRATASACQPVLHEAGTARQHVTQVLLWYRSREETYWDCRTEGLFKNCLSKPCVSMPRNKV